MSCSARGYLSRLSLLWCQVRILWWHVIELEFSLQVSVFIQATRQPRTGWRPLGRSELDDDGEGVVVARRGAASIASAAPWTRVADPVHEEDRRTLLVQDHVRPLARTERSHCPVLPCLRRRVRYHW